MHAAELDRKLENVDAEIAKLEEKAADLKGDATRKWAEERTALRERRKIAAEKLSDLKASSGDAWKELKPGLDSTWTELRKAVTDAADEFDDGRR